MVDWTLKRSAAPQVAGPVVMVVMDGVGVGPADAGNAVTLARTPTLDWLANNAAYTDLYAHGTHVGLPSDGDMGNSEVGHNVLGAGRVFPQGATLVDQAINSGDLFEGRPWKALVASGTLHLIGLLSDGNVHSHERHLHAMLRRARQDGVANACVHILLDGRDVHQTSALIYVERLEAVLAELGSGYRIASGGGRMHITMDRYNADWGMVERGWQAHVHGDARRFPSAAAAIATFRDETEGLSDQYLPAFVVEPAAPIVDGDAVVLFNFRGDRAIEITRAFVDETVPFERGRRPDVRFAGMMQYDGDLRLPPRFLVQPSSVDGTMGEYLAKNRVTQWACSETQKYGHVTYFWNGNRSGMFDEAYERYLEIPSDRVPFEQRPWMKAGEITDATLAAIRGGDQRLLRINYPNGDMVGHTGDLNASIVAMECLDLCLGRVVNTVLRAKGAVVITADHGNCDEMLMHDKQGGLTDRVSTSHSLHKVPLYIVGAGPLTLRPGGNLSHVAATTFRLLGYEPPDDYARPLFD